MNKQQLLEIYISHYSVLNSYTHITSIIRKKSGHIENRELITNLQRRYVDFEDKLVFSE